MKRIWVLFLAVLLLTGCVSGSFVTRGCVTKQTSTGISMKYRSFDGCKTFSLRIDGENPEIWVEIRSDSGSFGLTIEDADGNKYYSGNELPTSSFTVVLPQSGKYTVTVTARKHSGSFSLDWGK